MGKKQNEPLNQQVFNEPFGNEEEVIYIDELTFENRTDRVSMYGSMNITLDKAGLDSITRLQDMLARLAEKMRSVDLPDHVDFIAPVKGESPL